MIHRNKTPLVPESINPGDTIGIVAPAGLVDKEKLNRGVEIIKKMGFNVFVPDTLKSESVTEKEEYLAGTDNQRADLVNEMFVDETIKAIVCARGGFGSLRILTLLDYESIKKRPKIFMGFSDITILLSVLNTKCGLVTFHGPMATTLETSDQKSKEAMYSAFTSGGTIEIHPLKKRTIKSGLSTGIVSGGNLTSLCHLIGTPFEPSFEGHILVLEDISEANYRIDRMLTHMKLAGCFKGLSGLVLGSFEKCGSFEGITNIVKRIFKDDDIPILAGFGIGHGETNVTIPLGLEATLDTESNTLRYQAPATLKG